MAESPETNPGGLRGDVPRPSLFPPQGKVPRRRRPADAARLLVASAVFVLLGWAASSEPEVDARAAEFLADLPSWVRTFAWVGYTGSAIAALVLLIAGVAARAVRRAVVRDLLCALGVAGVLVLIAGRAATGAWPQVLPEIIEAGERLAYPTARPALVAVVVLVLGPYVIAGVQTVLRWMIVAVAVSPILLGVSTPTAILGSLSLSVLAVAAVRLAFGSPEGLPAPARLEATLEQVGVETAHLAYREDQPGTVGLATATATDGRPLDIKIYGADAASRQRAERIWRELWYRSPGPSPRAGRSEQAQHEALAVLTAREAGVNVPALVGAGQVATGDVVLVSIGARGTALDELAAPTEAQLAAAWRELLALHSRARIAHGAIGPTTVRLDGDDAELVDLADASLFPTEQQLSSDLVSMLASQAIAVGAEHAVDLAVRMVDSEALHAALPYLQDAVLAPEVRHELQASGIATTDLGDRLADRLDVERPEPARVRRVTWSDVAITIAVIIAANALITQITDVGLDTIIEELAGASKGWLIVAFVVNLMAYATTFIALKAVLDRPLPFSPTVLLQSAKSFVGLVVPSAVGRIGLDVRFLQQLGVPGAVATTQGPVISLIGFAAEAVLLALGGWAIGQQIDVDGLADIDAGGLLALAVAVVVVGIGIVLALPKTRHKVLPVIRQALQAARAIVSSPRTLGQIFASEVLDRLLKALALGATVAAFGASLPFPALVFVTVGTGLLAGLAPVPGGIGVAEATMAGLLTAAGLPAEQSVSIAVVHRLVTAYIPPVLGYFSFNWLTREGYL
jgi:uncharacterized membrane protein YbhN (UPF0104 family)/tRNA A-37 threonylcarbamoyl transferase component Bud32